MEKMSKSGLEPDREEVACYLCETEGGESFLIGVDDYTGKPGRFPFVTCSECGLVRQNPRLTLDAVKPFYDDAYLSHTKELNFGPLTGVVKHALSKHDRSKLKICRRHVALGSESRVLDVGCARGTFLRHTRSKTGASVSGIDFKDMSGHEGFDDIDFRQGLFYEQEWGARRFDLVTMWHFLEHCYDPVRSLVQARDLLAKDGRIVIEVPKLGSLSYQLFRERWPGVQAPQHTTLLDEEHLRALVEKAGLEVDHYQSWGAFPPYFYLYIGRKFQKMQGAGYDVRQSLGGYFAGQLALSPVLLFSRFLNLAMQLVVCKLKSSDEAP